MIRRSSLALLLLFGALPAAADEFAAQHITVYGTATREVAPDQMSWVVNVRTTASQGGAAAKAHGGQVASVLSLLKFSGVADSTIQTSRMQLGENWTESQGRRVRDGAFASTDVSFTLADLNEYANVWIGLSGLPGVTVRSVDLGVADRIRHQNEARIAAVTAARNKAQAIADALGVRLGEPLFVEEEQLDGGMPYRPTFSNVAMSAGGPAEAGEFIAPGTIPIKARVRAAFRMLSGS
ncbi:DUF541 domain-containing protein [bacterium]|nr:DUF541 domain-containing protein [bacterium]